MPSPTKSGATSSYASSDTGSPSGASPKSGTSGIGSTTHSTARRPSSSGSSSDTYVFLKQPGYSSRSAWALATFLIMVAGLASHMVLPWSYSESATSTSTGCDLDLS